MDIDLLKKLKSGTDIRGVASEGIDNEPINLTNDIVKRIACGFCLWLSQNKNKDVNQLKISVGNDSRISAKRIKSQLIDECTALGVDVIDCSLASTPSMFMTTIDLNCDGAISITASHHPFNKNGFKFFTKDGGLNSSDIDSLIKLACKDYNKNSKPTTAKCINYVDTYAEHLKDIICKQVNSKDYLRPLDGFKIIVDASNGAGGFYANKVLKPLGADITGSQFLEPDGMFPNHVPNPEDKNAMKSISDAVIKHHADLGIIFDTDVDRAAVVLPDGSEINRNKLIALASIIAARGNANCTIVTDSITSDGLKSFIEDELSCIHHRFKRGYKNVINEAIRLNNEGIDCPLAIETSGHAAFRENYFLDDGAYLAAKIIIKMANLKKENKSLLSVLSKLKEPLESMEKRIKIKCDDFKSYADKIIKDLVDYSKAREDFNICKENYEGIRVSFNKDDGDGWFLLRLSVHDPIMVLNIESNRKNGVHTIYDKIYKFLKNYKDLEI